MADSVLICSNCGHECTVNAHQHPLLPKSLLLSNEPAESSVLNQLRQLLDSRQPQIAIQADIAQVNAEIGRLQSTLKALQAKRTEMRKMLSACHKDIIFAPIRRVPNELVSKILLHALQPEYFDSDIHLAVTINANAGPWLYSKVCKLWRDDLLSRPSIWSQIRVEPDPNKVYNPLRGTRLKQSAPNILKTIFSRSRNLPLSLIIRMEKADSLAGKILSLAVEQTSRWKSITLPTEYPLQDHLKENTPFPLLENLTLQPFNDFRSNEAVWPKGVLFSRPLAPNLRHVTIRGLKDVAQLDLPWSQITQFRHTTRNSELHLLNLMPNLVSYHTSYTALSVEDLALQPISHNNLRALSLSRGDCFDAPMAPYLHLPALTEFYLREKTFLRNFETLQYSGKLHVLGLGSTGLGSMVHPVPNWLRRLPTITTLYLEYSNWQTRATFIRLLSELTNDCLAFPNLDTLFVPLCVGEPSMSTKKEYLRFITSRKASLKSVCIYGTSLPEHLIWLPEDIRALEADGLNVTFQRDTFWQLPSYSY